MATALELPQFGTTVEECLIARWFKRKGDSVAVGEVIAEIETDKTTFEVTANADGTVLEIFFEEGALVPVFSKLCVIGSVGENIDEFRSGGDAPERAPIPATRDGAAEAAPRLHVASRDGAPRAAPRTVYSPRASKFAAQHNFHPTSIAGSGPGGRVLEQDVRKAHESRARDAPRGRVSGIRDTIARRMRESLASTAQYTMLASADASGLRRLRARFKADSRDVHINDLVSFCTIKALLDAPELNAEFIDGEIVTHAEVHLAFACDTPRGLVAPVVRHAHALTIGELAARMQQLANAAVDGTISPDDLSGATFTISNLGGLGVEAFTPLINPPQVAILGVGAIQLKAVRAQDTVEFIDSIGVSLTCDHQVIDGAPGARFLQVLKDKIENVEAICPSP